jgi:hypothetical protein
MKRRLKIEEIKEMIRDEFGPGVDPRALRIHIEPWQRAKPAADNEWLKSVKMKEVFAHKLKKNG